LAFSGASPWEGAAAVAPEGELPATGRFVATNSFPANTIVDITNIENNRSTRVIVANSLNSPGLLAIVSREAAELLGMRPGSVIRIRMVQPSDPIAYLRFTEGVNANIPEYDSGNVITEEELLDELYRNDPYRPPSGETQTAQANGTRGPSYTLEQEWRDGRRIIDLPGFVDYPPITQPETPQPPVEQTPTPPVQPEQRVEPETPRVTEQPRNESVKDVPGYISEVPRNEADKDIPGYISEVPRNEADKDIPGYITEVPRSEVDKEIDEHINEVPRSEADKDVAGFINEVPRNEADKDVAGYLVEVPRNEANKNVAGYLVEALRNEADKDVADYITEVLRNEADKDATDYLTEALRNEADKDLAGYLSEVLRSEANKEVADYLVEILHYEANKEAADYLTEVLRNEADKDLAGYLSEVLRNEANKDVADYLAEVLRSEAGKDLPGYIEPIEQVTQLPELRGSAAPPLEPERPVEVAQIREPERPVTPPPDPVPVTPPSGQTVLVPVPTQPRPPIYGIDLTEIFPDTPPAREPARPPVPVTPSVTPAATPAPPDPTFSIPRIYSLDRGSYYVQLAALDSPDSVEATIRQIDRNFQPKVYKDTDNRYRILLGPLNQGESAAVLQRFKTIGFRDAFVRRGS
jgi:predicted house-cleaning noncanonical NTP pyrophosphatase (MazG superfamily)